MSGSWQIAQFDKTIGNAFDWVAVPNPCGPGGCTGMPGGAGLVAIKTTKDPKAVGRVMDYLAGEDVLREFYSRTLFVPGHLGLSAKGVDYPTASPLAKEALTVFTKGVADVVAAGLPAAGLSLQPPDVHRGDQPARPGGLRRNIARRGLQADRRRHCAADRRAQEVAGVMAVDTPHAATGRPMDRPDIWGVVVRLTDGPMRALQRVLGERRMPYVFLLPNLAFFALFVFVPLGLNLWYSLTGGAALFPSQRPYVGLSQYGFLFDCGSMLDASTCREDHFWRGVHNTLFFVVIQVTLDGAVLAGHGAGAEPADPRPRLLPRRLFLPGAAVAGGGGADLEVDPAARRRAQRRGHHAGRPEDHLLRRPAAGPCSGRSSSRSGRIWASTR